MASNVFRGSNTTHRREAGMEPGSRGAANTIEGGSTPPPASSIVNERRDEGMPSEKVASRRFSHLFTEDWLSVVVGLALVALVLTGILKNIP